MFCSLNYGWKISGFKLIPIVEHKGSGYFQEAGYLQVTVVS